MRFTLKQARTHAGLTQAQIAEKLGVGRGTYIKIERDPAHATIHQINQISAITGVPVGDIFLGINSTKVDKPSLEE